MHVYAQECRSNKVGSLYYMSKKAMIMVKPKQKKNQIHQPPTYNTKA
uniref:Uncharacterized protein n=1 Tax=Arundo donax TaxID=35708 RepID=A0A0A9BA22_ARUDO